MPDATTDHTNNPIYPRTDVNPYLKNLEEVREEIEAVLQHYGVVLAACADDAVRLFYRNPKIPVGGVEIRDPEEYL